MRGQTLVRALLAAGTLAGIAHAQNTAGDDDIPGAAGSLSPIDGRGFQLGASIKTLYDSNIRRLGDGFTPGAGQSRADFRFTPSISAAGAYPIGRQQVFVNADYGRDIYARNERFNRDRYGVLGGVIWRLGQACAGSITGGARRRQSLLTEDSGQGPNVQEITNLEASGDCAPPVGLGFGGGVSHRSTDNKTPERAALDSRETTFEAHANFGAPALGVFSAGGSYSRFNYPRRDVFVPLDGGGIGQVTDKLESWSARLGYSRSIGTRLSVNASASYLKVKPDPRNTLALISLPDGVVFLDNPRDGYTGPGYSLGLNYRSGSRFSAALYGSRNATSSPNVSARVVVRDNIGASLTYNIGPSIDAVVGGTYDRRRYKGGFVSPTDPVVRERDTSGRIFARVSYQPRPLYGLDFEVAHQKRDSNPSIYNFSSTSAMLTLHAKFGRG